MLIKDLVVKDDVSIDVEKDVLDALFIMFSNRQRILPVLRESRFAGTIRIADYVKVLQDIKNKEPESVYVSDIMDDEPISVSPNKNVDYVVDRLCEKGTYGVAVISGYEFAGIVKREDILKHFLPLIKGKFNVGDVMSYNVSTYSIHDTLEKVGERILSGVERRVVITDNHTVEGTMTIRDIANVLLAEKVDLSSLSVKDVLTPNPVTLKKSDDIAKAARTMLEWGVWGIPVVGRELEGLIRDKDIIQRIIPYCK